MSRNILTQSKLHFLIFFICFASIVNSLDSPKFWYKESKNLQISHDFAQRQYLFDQILDHSDYLHTSYWSQRYWISDDYFDPKVGPIYLCICGQWTCGGINDYGGWPVALAQQTKGLLFAVEHRFYGQSMPFGNQSLSFQNMKFLTSQQALSDLAYFISQIRQNQMFNVGSNPWIVVGGSYPGALSAWFRYKYPHFAISSIASSAVVQSVQNLYMFDQQIYLSANKSGDYCWKAINSSNAKVQQILASNQSQSFKKQFQGGINLTNDQFLFFWADAIVMKVQYGSRQKMCSALQNKSQGDQFNYFVEEAKKHQVFQYGSFFLKNQTFNLQRGSSARAWYYQSCTQFGYWQTPSTIHPLRSQRLNLDFYRKFCSDAYGQGTWPKTIRKNTETGGWNLQGSQLLMANGDQDPWKWASVQESKDNIIARIADCDDCGHCVDLHSPSSADSSSLKQIRSQQLNKIEQWVDKYWKQLQSEGENRLVNKKIIAQ